MNKLKQFFLSLILFIVFDFIWLGYVMKSFNMAQLAEIGRIENGVFDMQYPAAMIAYILMALALVFYVVPQPSKVDKTLKVFFMGALMGLIIFGVFDMTNLAILKNYPIAFILPDVLWGGFVFGLVTVITAKVK